MSHDNRHNLRWQAKAKSYRNQGSDTQPAGGGAITEEGDEQTETDELGPIIAKFNNRIRREGRLDQSEIVTDFIDNLHTVKQEIRDYSYKQIIQVLRRLQREAFLAKVQHKDGKGPVMVDTEIILGSALRAEFEAIAALRVGLEGKHGASE